MIWRDILKVNMKSPFLTKPFCLTAHRASSRAMSALERLAEMAGGVVEVACEEKNACRDQFPDEYFL